MAELDEIMQWMHIEEKSRHLPHLSNLYRLAMANLRRLNDEHAGAAEAAEAALNAKPEPEPQVELEPNQPREDDSTTSTPEERVERRV